MNAGGNEIPDIKNFTTYSEHQA